MIKHFRKKPIRIKKELTNKNQDEGARYNEENRKSKEPTIYTASIIKRDSIILACSSLKYHKNEESLKSTIFCGCIKKWSKVSLYNIKTVLRPSSSLIFTNYKFLLLFIFHVSWAFFCGNSITSLQHSNINNLLICYVFFFAKNFHNYLQ